MQLQDYVRFARRWVPLALVPALIFGLLAYVLTDKLVQKQYVATVTMEVELGLPTSGTIDPNSAAAYAATEAVIANQENTVKQATAVAAHEVPAADSKKGVDNVSCSPHPNTTLFSCSVTSRSPRFAVAVANSLATVFIANENAWQQSRYSLVLRHIQQQIASAKRSHNTSVLQALEPLYPEVQLASAQQSNLARLVTPATLPKGPSTPHPLLNAAIVFALMFILVLGAGRVAVTFDDSLYGEDDLKALTDLPVVGSIPTIGELRGKPFSGTALQVWDSPQSAAAEAYRAARTGITFARSGKQSGALLFTSAHAEEGKSTAALNVAAAFAEAGKRVILVDLDFWHHALSSAFAPAGRGVADLLIEGETDPSTYLIPSPFANLQILPTGSIPPNPAELLASPKLGWIMRDLRNMADLVVVDSPPLLSVADAAVVATLCDGVVLVVRPNKSKRKAITRSVEILRLAGVSIVGVVLNACGKGTADSYFDMQRASGNTRLNFQRQVGSQGQGAATSRAEEAVER